MLGSKTAIWTGLVLSGLVILFLLGASVTPKLTQMSAATDSLARLGWSPAYLPLIGMIELACVILYAIPRTALLGAVLTTGLLGGAMASNIRAEMPLYSHILFGLYLGLFLWGGLWLRDPALRRLFPIRRN